MKILQIIQRPQMRGAETFTSQLSEHISANGHDAIIVSLFKGTSEVPFTGKVIDLNGNEKNKYFDIKAWKYLAQIINQENPHVIQANAGDTLKYVVFSKLLFRWKQPIVFRNASTISLYIKSSLVKKLYHFLFSKTEQVLSVSQTSAKDFISVFPEYKDKVQVIPIGIEVPEKHYNSIHKQVEIHPEFKGLNLIHVGGFTFEKNHKGLISIFKKLQKKYENATLHLVGDGPLRKNIEQLVVQEKIENKVIFHGFQTDVLARINNADVLLLPSIIEGLPGVILEAFFCKTPVVTYDTGGIHEVVKDKHTGYLVPKENEEAFVNAIDETLQNKQQTSKQVEQAFNLVTQSYLNTIIAKRFLNFYKKIAVQ